MDNIFLQDLNDLVHQFQKENINGKNSQNISGFKKWGAEEFNAQHLKNEEIPEWIGKEVGRTPESVISTLIVHLNRYARRYSDAAISGSDFASQDDFIYLINLKAFGQMIKKELIRMNIHDESEGLKIISRLESNGWIENKGEVSNTISDLIQITENGEKALQNQMNKIRKATAMVAGDLSHQERIELIKLLTKLELHHKSVFSKCEIKDLIQMMQ